MERLALRPPCLFAALRAGASPAPNAQFRCAELVAHDIVGERRLPGVDGTATSRRPAGGADRRAGRIA